MLSSLCSNRQQHNRASISLDTGPFWVRFLFTAQENFDNNFFSTVFENFTQKWSCMKETMGDNTDTFCEFGALPAFIRVPQALIMGIPTLVRTSSVLSCAGFCRNNTEPSTGARRLCQGFNFQVSPDAVLEAPVQRGS